MLMVSSLRHACNVETEAKLSEVGLELAGRDAELRGHPPYIPADKTFAQHLRAMYIIRWSGFSNNLHRAQILHRQYFV